MSDLQTAIDGIRARQARADQADLTGVPLELRASADDVAPMLAALEAALEELRRQDSTAAALLQRGNANRAAAHRWTAGLLRDALEANLKGATDESR